MEKKDYKNEFLGMSGGKASNILKKQILFMFVQRCNEDICFKCGKKIETVDELSIEHKLPWLDRDVNLFWDLNNIAFSHLKCNKQHRIGAIKLRKIGPEGTAWCTRCKEFLSLVSFSPSSSRWNGVNKKCKICSAEYRELQRVKSREKYAQMTDEERITYNLYHKEDMRRRKNEKRNQEDQGKEA